MRLMLVIGSEPGKTPLSFLSNFEYQFSFDHSAPDYADGSAWVDEDMYEHLQRHVSQNGFGIGNPTVAWTDALKRLAARSKPSPSFSKDGTKYSSKLEKALARLDELVDWERSHRSVGDNRLMRVSSSPCRDLLEKLGSPQKKLRTVHVTGSKGKGSVVALIALALKEEGFRTGCFCSPHVSRVNERVLIDLEECDDDLLAKSLENVLDVRAKLELHSSTWFDSLAAAGLALLAEEKVDWAIVEVGLGGRLDSTNVLDSELCVITNIMLEHQAIIGPGRREIAYEKAGIIRKRGCSVITGVQPSDSEVVEQIMKCAADAQALEPVFVPSLKPSESFTEVNARIAATTLEEMGRRGVVSRRTGVALSGALINDDLRNRASKVLKGRMELFEYKGVPVVIDGAHVPESVKAAVSEAHLRNYAIGPQVLLIAVGSDKDEKAIASKAIEAQVPFHRIVTTRIGKSSRYTSSAQVEAVENPTDAIERSVLVAEETNGYVLVVGSLHLAGVIREKLIRR